jgi:septum formation protein
MNLVLASGSPRRRELLEQLGLVFEVVVPNVDESRLQDEPAQAYVERVARAKADAGTAPGRVVVAADTTVVFKGKVLGKPGHPEEARAMLRQLEGERHEVFTGVACATMVDATQRMVSLVDATEVVMQPMTEEEISGYVDTGEPMDKAGAYALQGRAGLFVTSINGSPSNVIGLPIHLLPRLLRSVGYELDQFTSGNAVKGTFQLDD